MKDTYFEVYIADRLDDGRKKGRKFWSGKGRKVSVIRLAIWAVLLCVLARTCVAPKTEPKIGLSVGAKEEFVFLSLF